MTTKAQSKVPQSAGILVPATSTNLSKFEPLINDTRLERIFWRVIEAIKSDDLPTDIAFATYVQPPTEKQANAMAVFMVSSLHPKQRFPGRKLMTIAATQYRNWKEAEAQKYHYVGLGDPAHAIFLGLAQRHMRERKDLTELIDKK